jgi:salicylate synthase
MPELGGGVTTQVRPGLRYAATSAQLDLDPIDAGAGLARNADGQFVLFERHGEVSVGFGAAAEIVMDRRRIRFRAQGGWETVPTGGEPLQQVGELLAGCGIADWRAYGWFGFELSYLLHGMPELAGDATLAHLIVPAAEARLTPDNAELRALRIADLGTLCDEVNLLREEPARQVRGELTDEMVDYDGYRHRVASAVADIRARRLQKVILSRIVPVPGGADLVSTYQAGRRGNTPARSFLLNLGDLRAAGFSPETVVEVRGDGTVTTQPLAGTRALSGAAMQDAALCEELLNDPKEVYEHAVSVRGAQEELRAVCVDGSVLVEEFMSVSRRGSVQHLASRVTGQLIATRNRWHAMAGLFPAVTVSGLPKPQACEAIQRYENEPRDLYGGAVVVAGADGSLDAALVLRTVFQRGERTWLRVGAGVVEQSTPEREFEETREKLRSISRFLVAAEKSAPVGDAVVVP